MIHVGEKVEISALGAVYASYSGFLDYYREVGRSSTVDRVCSQYVYGRSPTLEEARGVFTVMFVREHGSIEGRKLAIINNGRVTFIFNENALTLVASDIPFTEGDRVFIKNTDCVYSAWRKLIKHVSTVIPDGVEVYRKWAENHSPTADGAENRMPEGIFTVKWVGHHVARPQEAVIAIISNDTHTYIMGVEGLAKAGEKSWDKYIIYVRNWAVVNKDTAQSVRDATGPKTYAEWLNNKS